MATPLQALYRPHNPLMHHALGHQVVTHLRCMYGVYTYTLLLTLYGQHDVGPTFIPLVIMMHECSPVE